MKTKNFLAVLVGVGLIIDTIAAPFTFPNNENEGRSTALQDYDDYDSRIHHHHQHHNQHGHHSHHHGGFNKRKKLKKKRKKRPCYYKTTDGRTFFWTGLNIYETNIYVNQGQNPHQSDIGAGPCNGVGEADDGLGQYSPQPGSLQSPQRPNRPFLQNLATYIPSGPTTWNWLQGIQWGSYIPNQHSIGNAINSAVNYLPGFGPSRPRPPSPPVRPVTESPFTRPTDFTRPPTFIRPTQQPIYTRPTQQPIYTRPTQQPIYTRPTQQPIYTRPTQPPTYRPSTTSTIETSSKEGSDEDYDYSNFSSENMSNSQDSTALNGLGSSGNKPASNIPTLGSIGNGIKPVYERPTKYFNDYIVKPFRGSIREVVSWFRR